MLFKFKGHGDLFFSSGPVLAFLPSPTRNE